jgi:putative hemolysin
MSTINTTAENVRLRIISHFSTVKESVIERRIDEFQSKLRIKSEAGRFIVKTADNGEELRKALRLRYDVFFKELLGFNDEQGIDYDRFDLQCDHLILIEKESQEVVGTYRLNPSVFNKTFYSASEFGIGPIIRLKGHKLELGRSCVNIKYRNALSIASLWRGLTEYMRAINIRWLFGCTSLMTTDPESITSVYMYLKENHYSDKSMRVQPRIRFGVPSINKFEKFINSLPPEKRIDASKLIPPLLRSYIKAGAVVCGAPALDRDMRCADFFTLLDTTQIMENYDRRFKVST